MHSRAEISVLDEDQRRNIELVALYAGASPQIKVSPGSTLALRNPDGRVQLEGLNTICRFIANLGDNKAQLLGEDDAAKTEVVCNTLQSS